MRERLLSHPGLKAAAIIIAFVVWLAIMNVSNPVITRTITNIPVNVTNPSYIESMNLSYALADGFDTISVSVEGNRSLVEKLSASNISANVDLTQIIDMNANPVMVPVTVSVPGVNQNAITVIPRNIQLRLEEMESKDFVLGAVTGNTVPARGYEVGSLATNPEKLTIRGPSSMIQRIDKVQAEVDVSYLDSDAVLGATLHVYDKNGDELTESRMNYLTFSVSEDAVRVYVELYKVISEIPIIAEPYGEPKAGYQVGEVSVTPQTISIAGSDEALAEFKADGNRILIAKETRAVDITGASEDVEIRVNLPDYLPAGIRLASGFSDTVVVTVKILQYNTKSLELDTKHIEKQNIMEGRTMTEYPDIAGYIMEGRNAVIENSVVDIRVKGSDQDLEGLTADMISASVDLKDVPLGTSTVPVHVTLPDNFALAEDVLVDITVTENTVLSQNEETEAVEK